MDRQVFILAGIAGLALAAWAATSQASMAPSSDGSGSDTGTQGGILDWLGLTTAPIDYSVSTGGDGGVADAGQSADPGIDFGIWSGIQGAVMGWKTGEYPKYATAIQSAEDRYGIPRDLLARLLYQESHYRADIIDGSTRSSAGAVGIAQFMPATAASLQVNPLDPFGSIEGAARYLRQNYNSFGSWSLALMAYNWGPGNVRKWQAGTVQEPAETSQYVAQITSDVQVA